MIKIVDASVAIKWFIDEEVRKKEAEAVLDHIKSHPQEYAVPELFFCEMLSVLCRLLKEAKKVKEYVVSLMELGWSILSTGRKTMLEAAELAISYNLSGYDAIYAANAKLVSGVWITADKNAHRKIKSLHLSSLL